MLRRGLALAAVKFAPPPLVDTAPRTASGLARATCLIEEARSRRFLDVKMAGAVAKGAEMAGAVAKQMCKGAEAMAVLAGSFSVKDRTPERREAAAVESDECDAQTRAE